MDRRAALLAIAMLGLSLALARPGEGPGPTPIEGPVSGVWTVEDSPYLLVGNATVPPGLTLEVQAGVHVIASRGVRLGVEGSLLVRGTGDAPVRFGGEGAADAGFWQGIVASGADAVVLEHAVVEHAETALAVSGGAATLTGTSLSASFHGLLVSGGTATIVEGAVSGNTVLGIVARASTVDVRGGLVSGNREGVQLVASQALLENTTFLGNALGDLSLDQGSAARLRASPHEGLVKFVDTLSRVDVEGILTVAVADAHGSPVVGASVFVDDNANGTGGASATTGGEGVTQGLVLTERTLRKAGDTDFNPFAVSAESHGIAANGFVTVRGITETVLALPADLTPPAPVASRLLAVNEDASFTLDASGSTDNDPAFPSTGTFRWSFPEAGVVLTGKAVTHRFATPRLYQGVLTATDAAGNAAILTFAVEVRDITPPTLAVASAPVRGAVGQMLAFEASATDNDPDAAASVVWRFTLDGTAFERTGPRVEIAFDRPGTWGMIVTATDAAGNDVTQERTLVIEAPTPPSPWPLIGGAIALVGAAAALATERGRLGLLTLFLPLYSRLKDDQVLDQFTRGQIFGYIRVHPGDTYTDIKRNLDLNAGTLTYHLDVLERGGLVRSMTRGVRKLFYPIDVRPPENGGGLHEIQQRLLRVLNEAPGTAVSDLGSLLGIGRQLALYHLRLLSQQGLVRLERRGVRLCAFAVGPKA